jgi:hypothetical protein
MIPRQVIFFALAFALVAGAITALVTFVLL